MPFYLKKIDNVYLTEKEYHCGGLLRLIHVEDQGIFDMGTHIPAETLNEEIDSIPFKDINYEQWSTLANLEVGNVFNGQFYKENSYILLLYQSMSIKKD